ncbi:MAG: protein kinase, partial [Tepidisphaeraceae bacterium]
MKKIDRFHIVERISEGGAAVVYKAEEQLPGGLTRPVALKVFPALASNDKVGETRFLREIRPLLSFSGHPHIVCFYGAAVTDGTPWIAMEYAETTLADSLGDLPGSPEDVQTVLEHVGFALSTMHAKEPPVLHNDLKPANILICNGPSYKLADFGVAGKQGEERTRVVTTVRYAAP